MRDGCVWRIGRPYGDCSSSSHHITMRSAPQLPEVTIRWNWDFALLVRLRRPAPVRFVTDAHGRVFEIDVRPVRVHDLLFSHAGHQEELEPQSLLFVTGFEERVQFVLFVNLGFFLRVTRPVVFLTSPRIPFKLVVHAPWRLLFMLPQKGAELEEVLAFDVVQKELSTGLREVVQCGRVRGQRLLLLRELGFLAAWTEDCQGAPVSICSCTQPYLRCPTRNSSDPLPTLWQIVDASSSSDIARRSPGTD